jgi:pimeloyl-ACP methyl ester carboxylesterase
MSFHEGLDDLGTYYQIRKVDGTTPILFIHGVGLDHSMWSPQTDFFKNQTTIVYDLIGHGYSTCTQHEVNFEDFSKQIESLLQILRIQKVIIIGFSLGGLIAAHFSSTRKHYALKTVLFGTIFNRTDEQQKKAVERFINVKETYLNAPQQLDRWFNQDYLSSHPDIAEKIANILNNNNHDDFLKSYKLFVHFEDKLIEFKQIEAETLVCTAKGDVGSTPDMTNQLGEVISNSKVIIFDQGKHMVGIECAEEVNKVFSNFIEGKS